MIPCAIPVVYTNEKATCVKLLFPKRNRYGRFASMDVVIWMSEWKAVWDSHFIDISRRFKWLLIKF